jgi:ABC-type transport system involved in cytochrome c biogenesis permease subunit
MITWNNFDWFALLSIALWGSGAVFALFSKERNRWAILLTLMGTLVFAVFIAGFWIYLQRPPLRTMGETRLWYSFFMGISGLLTYIRWKYPWILSFSTVVGAVFALINILKPEIHDQSLMPALQSPWFIPHVTIYMFSYSVLGCAFILSCMGLFKHRSNYLEAADKLIYTGLAFLTVGAIWAKAAWGHYWSWDPKETWAAVTWTGYLLYVHLRLFRKASPRMLYWIVIASFLALQMCWYGVNYLPAARQSVHSYSRS